MDDLFNRVSRRRRSGEGGFTLIELLVVIAVLAILALIVLFNVLGVANRGQSSACGTDVKTIQTAVDSYYNDNLVYPMGTDSATSSGAVNLAELQPKYIHELPSTSVDGSFTYKDTSGTVTASKCASA